MSAGSRLQSFPKLVSQTFIDDGTGAGTVEAWEDMAGLRGYDDYWRALFDEEGNVLPWSESGLPLTFPPHYADADVGLKEWYVHLAGMMPGIFELAQFDDPFAVDSPSSVETFEFDGYVIGPLPMVEIHEETHVGPIPTQRFRFWPGKYAELIP